VSINGADDGANRCCLADSSVQATICGPTAIGRTTNALPPTPVHAGSTVTDPTDSRIP